MTAFNKIMCILSVAAGFAFASAADSTIKKVKLSKSNEVKINKDGRVLQEIEYVCDAEGLALATCGIATQACIDLASDMEIPLNHWCSMSSDVNTFCVDAQNMMDACGQDCYDAVQDVTACMLKEGGCSEDRCSSPGFKAGVSVASALGAAVTVIWMFMFTSI